MDEPHSSPLSNAVNLANFLSREEVLRLALTSPGVAGTLNWLALWRNEATPRRPRRAQLPLTRPRPPITFAPRAVDAFCRIAALDETNAAAFRRLATGDVSRGTVVTWGGGSNEHDDEPTAANFVAVACGDYHSVGLRADGTVVTWGGTRGGQRNEAPTDANFVAISCGYYHCVGLQTDGTVVTWGDMSEDQRDEEPTDANFVAVACGYHHSCGIRETRHLRG